MADIPINAVTRRVQFTGNTGLGPFAFTFEILANTDIAVYKNATLLTLTTDYTVTINANGTGSVTLTGSGSGTALVASDYLTIIGNKPLARTTDFTTAGDLLASALNDQLDANVIMNQQLDERVDRALRQDPDDVDGDMTIPAKADRLGKILRFNATTGDPEVITLASGATSAANVSFTQAGAGAVERTVETKLNESVSVKDFGAVGDGVTDDTAAIQAAIDYVNGTGTYGIVSIPPSSGEYIFTAIQNKTKVTLLGLGGVLKLKDNTASNAATNYYPVGNLTGTECVYDGLIIDGNSANNTLFNVCDSITCSGEGSIVRNCKILDAADSGIMFTAATHGQCINNYVKGTTDAGIYVNNSSEVSDDLEGAIISGNVCQDCDYGGITIKRSSGYIIVSNNTIHNCGNGLTVEEFGTGSGGEPDHLLIANNLVKDIGYSFRSLSPAPSESGLNVQLSKHCVITGNKFVNVSGLVFGLDGAQFCTVTGNNFRGYQTDPLTTGFGNVGLMLTLRDSISPDYNVISGNIISGCEDEGIYVVQGEYNVITSNVVREIDGAGASNQAFRIEADGDNNIVSDNVFHAPTVDTGINSGALGNIFDTNKTPNATGTAINGIRRDAANITPVGNVVPLYAGEFYFITTGSKLFFATGTTNTDWIALN